MPITWQKGAIRQDVCKPANIFENSNTDVQKIQAQLVILSKLKDSTNILKFYGISKVDGNQVMIFEWVEFVTLRELYVEKDISWRDKVLIALDICRGLTFLHSCDIPHHDIRCHNIMVILSCSFVMKKKIEIKLIITFNLIR